MPILEKAVIQNWRNIELQELEFSPNINCISGNNGEGKTNLLDAIHCLSMSKSAFNSTDRWNYRHGTDFYAISGTYLMHEGQQARFSIRSSAGEDKKLTRDGKAYTRISDHIGVLPIVMVSPGDTALVSDGSEERRRLVNAVLSQMDKEYLSDVQRYTRLLTNRNAILKSGRTDESVMETIDLRMDSLAGRIYNKRSELAQTLEPVVARFYSQLSGGAESVGISYRSELEEAPLLDLLRGAAAKDRQLGFTTCGVQRDDFIFTMNGDPIRKVGSQGQQKSFLVALKFAQYEIMKASYGFPPALLLDDLFDKLDMDRTGNLLKMVASDEFGQIFISDTDSARLKGIISGITQESGYYQAKGGVFTKL